VLERFRAFFAAEGIRGLEPAACNRIHLASLSNATYLMPHAAEVVAKLRETHHIHKLDAPSGTAITLAEGILENIDRKDKWVEGTFTAPDGTISGTTDCAPDELPISSIREGEVFGIHTVRYESDIDSISITHDAKNRGGFVLGAILAAEYTAHHEGFLGMKNLFPFLNE